VKLHDVYDRLQAFAPKSLSDEYCKKYGAYDNSGVLLDSGEEVKKILFALDFSAAAIERAEEIGANLIVTHHPAIYAKIGNILFDDPQGRNLRRAIAKGMSVISMHLNFDCAAGGIDENLMRGIGGKAAIAVMEPVAEKCGYGRVYEVAEKNAEDLAKEIQTTFSAKRILCYGEERKVKRVASFCGAGASEEAILWAKEHNADCVVSSDFKHHILTMAAEREMSVIVLTHYAAEIYGFERIYRQLKDLLGAESEFFRDDRWM
jgi:dinuclear metal center YbgI/SA1388 family protein